ncbi:putative 2OG-Fe(II) oxygenase [Pseudomonas phage pPa_SNUABM_DT01]|nr:putative 2OG-Fe(II) oxygenase [Pseudomonas phage pPa_SNUABM_DT01]
MRASFLLMERNVEIIQPWKTEIAHFNVADRFDMEAYAEEIFLLFTMTQGEDASQVKVLRDVMPLIIEIRDDVITPAVKEFSKHAFGTSMEEFYVETNGKWIESGEGLYPHYHPGSVLSAICYPSDSANGLNMFDPRGNACRGYPKPMRQFHFGNYRISPKAGDVYIFPSYIQHSVTHVTEEMRLSLLHEYYVVKDL